MIRRPFARIGLDPGTANTLLYVKGRGIAVNEPSLVTVRAGGGIEAVGAEAEAGLGRTPERLRTERPVRAGSLGDLGLFQGMLHRFLRKARLAGPLNRLKAAVAVPGTMAGIERLAMVEALKDAGAADVLLVDQTLAAARGAGLPIEESRGRMVVNIGAGVTDIAVISMGTTVSARAARVAGDEMDAAIIAHVQAVHRLAIGERTAQRLKIQIGSALPDSEENVMRVKGRCLVHGVPREAVVRAAEVRQALSRPLRCIVNAIREALEDAPAELSADLIETGIVLTGGSALLRNLDLLISRDCGLPVQVAQDPLSCVILGLASQIDRLRRGDWRRSGDVSSSPACVWR
ncbi:MAG: rod shape-determining protein [Rhodospirillales bacterium]